MSTQNPQIGFIGAGNMASALLEGLRSAGLSAAELHAFDLDASKLKHVEEKGLATPSSSMKELILRSEVVILAVKPNVLLKVCTDLQADAPGPLWISIAAGLQLKSIEESLGGQARVIRVMPNTPALVGAGAAALAQGKYATAEDLEQANAIMAASGRTAHVDEKLMDAVTGLSGSGPAFMMLIIEALADAAVKEGLPRQLSIEFAAQTMMGAAKLVLETGQHPAVLKDAVTSPGGTTIAGVAALEKTGLRKAMMAAVAAATSAE